MYRLCPTKANGLSATTFFSEFATFLESAATIASNFLLVGDLNFHVDVPTDSEAVKFLDLLNSADLQQHVKERTHISGHTLD